MYSGEFVVVVFQRPLPCAVCRRRRVRVVSLCRDFRSLLSTHCFLINRTEYLFRKIAVVVFDF